MKDWLLDRFRQWRADVLEPSLERIPNRQDEFRTTSGIPLNAVELPEHPDPDYLEKLGFPGEPPYTRGIHPAMYRSRLWTMRQYAGFGSAEETNQRFHYLLDQGQTGLSVAFDLPTQIGLDPDHPLALGEVGRVGVSIASLDNMRKLFQGIPLDKVSTSMTINAPASVLLAMYVLVGQEQGAPTEALRGTIQNDILKEYTSRGTYIFPPRHAMRLITDTFAYCAREAPQFNTISISGYHIREAGATAAQELAFTLANALAYVEAAQKAGIDLATFLERASFFLSADSNFLEEIAKFRAARRMWSRLLPERFGIEDERARQFRFHTQTAGSSLTAQQPQNNVVRVTLQALAAVLGGTQSLHTNSMDEALGLPTREAARIALRTQQIIAYESGVTDSADPLGGSYLVEKLTDQLEAEAQSYLEQIADLGGALAAIEAGYIQREIQQSAYEAQMAIQDNEKVIVGVNRFDGDESPPIEILKLDPQIEAAQRRHIAELRSSRDQNQVETELGRLAVAAQGEENMIPRMLACLESSATIGEICDVLRQVWGEHQPAPEL